MPDDKPDLNLDDAPEWFIDAINYPTQSQFTKTSDGYRVHYVGCNGHEGEKPVLLFVHGRRASSIAWKFIAPFFVERYRVYCMDFSGMGESQYRDEYDEPECFLRDIDAVVEAISDDAPVTLICHSFGGAIGVSYLNRMPEKVKRLVVVDAPVIVPGIEGMKFIPRKGRPIPYPEYFTIAERYVLDPQQPALPWILRYMAYHSIKKVEGGWLWKFDPEITNGAEISVDYQGALFNYGDKLDLVCGDSSALFSEETLNSIRKHLKPGRDIVVIPNSHHHIMLDQPLALIAALKALLSR